jgi:hypothetical protein
MVSYTPGSTDGPSLRGSRAANPCRVRPVAVGNATGLWLRTASSVHSEASITDFTRAASLAAPVHHGIFGSLALVAIDLPRHFGPLGYCRSPAQSPAMFAVPFFVRPDPDQDDYVLGHRFSFRFSRHTPAGDLVALPVCRIAMRRPRSCSTAELSRETSGASPSTSVRP